MEAAMRHVLLSCIFLTMLCSGCGSTRAGRENVVAVTLAAYSQQAYSATATAGVPAATARAAAKQTVVVQRAPFIRDLNEAEQTWQAAGIAKYRLRSHYDAEVSLDAMIEIEFDHAQTTRVNCSTRGTALSACSCLRTEDYTVAGLFQQIRQAISDPEWSVTAKYDPTYGLPRSIDIVSLRYTGGKSIRIEEFTVLT